LKKKNIYNTGSANRAGLTATSGNIIFASGTDDNLFRAFNSETGDELWSYKMHSAGSAPPTVYEVKGKQHVLLPAYELDGYKVYSFTLE
jgi:quinoprotein glucose dehydrogenase